MSTSSPKSSEEQTKGDQQDGDVSSSSASSSSGGRKLTPLPITNPNAKPGQIQVIFFEYFVFICNLKLKIVYQFEY